VAELKDDVQRVLTPATVESAAWAVRHRWRKRLLGPATTVALFALQILHGNVACRAVSHLARMDFTDTAYANARKRLPLDLFTQLAWMLTDAARGAHQAFGRWHGHRVLLIDGSGLSMPDTPALQRAFGQPGRVKPGCGFPVMHTLWLFDAATGLIIDLLHNRHDTHDMADATKVHPMLEEGDVLVGELPELWMYMLVYNLVRLRMLDAAKRQGCDVDRISFIDALDAMRYRGPDAADVKLRVNPKRPGRHQPRRIKRPKDRYTYLTRPISTYRLC